MSEKDVAIIVDKICKRYRLGQEITEASTIAGKISNVLYSPFKWLHSQIKKPDEDQLLWALRDVSFTIKKGEVVGFIGHNGAGKSTLLKILSRITEPSEGYAEIHGRLAALLEVGTGMHPELTGRENIYMNGTVLGMKKREIDIKFNDIADFSGVSKFLDTPVKHYSSGMRVRLGFAIAAHLEPEILVVDEVLAVGDMEFQVRCLDKMQEVASGGRTVLFVSHNMGAILSLCNRVILLKEGKVVDDGYPKECIAKYYGDNAIVKDDGEIENIVRNGNGEVFLKKINIIDDRQRKVSTIIGGLEYEFIFEIHAKTKVKWKRVNVAFNISTAEGGLIAYLDNTYTNTYLEEDVGVVKEYRCRISRFPLISGKYIISTFITYNGIMADHMERVICINVDKGNYYISGKQAARAPVMLDYRWSIQN